MILDFDLADRFARSTLNHIDREYPHGLAHVMAGPEVISPARLHPIFFGSFDWHSCVHAWWQALRLARLFPALNLQVYPRATLAFTTDNVAGELRYLEAQPWFERPYGWGWLLALHAEASLHHQPFAETLAPMARLIADRFREYLPKLRYPVRAGAHANTAFSLILARDWAVDHDRSLVSVIDDWARSRFGLDRNAAHQEPSGEDFLSPTLTEALLMSRVFSDRDFEMWFDRFLPELPPNLLEPVEVSDRSDGRIGHLDGLNLSRAWCWRGLAQRRPTIANEARSAANRHLGVALPHLTANYMSEHWLTTFALLALES